MEQLYLVFADGTRKPFLLDGDLVLIGRAPSNDLVLDSPSVSGHHARLTRTGEGWTLEDLGSRNGVLLSGRKVQSVALSEGDRIKLGAVELVATSHAPAEHPPPEPTLSLGTVPGLALPSRATRGAPPSLAALLEDELRLDERQEPLDRRWAEVLRTFVGAEGAFFFRVGDSGGAGGRAGDGDLAYEASSERQDPGRISRTALAECLRRGEAVWAPADLAKPGASLNGLAGPVLMAFPLLMGTQAAAVIYLDWGKPCQEPSLVLETLRAWPPWATHQLAALWRCRSLDRKIHELEAGRESLSLALHRRIEAGPILGRSPAIRKALELAERAAPTPHPVLLLGETGTGKELFARWIHLHSERAAGPFVALNCAAVHAETAESELFGHVRGAYTGAVRDHAGLFEQASGGTLFLDEIGDMAPALQAKILRTLQFKVVRRMGDSRDRKVEVRLLAAAHPRTMRSIGDGTFRPDLYYRLSTFEILLPALRERASDVPLLAAHFLEGSFRRSGTAEGFTPGALQLLRLFDWPGNVRQLESVVNHLAAIATEPLIEEAQVRSLLEAGGRLMTPDFPGSSVSNFREARLRFEECYLERLLDESEGNVAEASRRSGIPLRTLFRRLQKVRGTQVATMADGPPFPGKEPR
ncbi:MAG: sigma 54-interacting transcriptional regulator [Acidobacteriota bacterium]